MNRLWHFDDDRYAKNGVNTDWVNAMDNTKDDSYHVRKNIENIRKKKK